MKVLAPRIAVLLGVFAILYCGTPPDLPVCGFRWLTGLPCPLCGLTRAMFALAKGHFRDAIHFHALSPLAAVMVFAMAWNPPRWERFWTACAAAFVAFGAARMFL